MNKLKSRIHTRHKLNFSGDYSCETVAFFSEEILVLRLWDQQTRQPLLQFRRVADLQLLLSLPLAEYDGSQLFCRWSGGLALLGKSGLWFWPEISTQEADFYPLHNSEVWQQQLQGQQYQFTPLQMVALDDQQLLLRMSGANNRHGRAISWLFINEDGDCHIVNRFKELDDAAIAALPSFTPPPVLTALAVNDGTIWGLCSPATDGTASTDGQLLVPYRYQLPDNLLSSLSQLLGAGQKRELLLQSNLRQLATGNAVFSENNACVWLRPKGKKSLECHHLNSGECLHRISLTPAQNLGDINLRQAHLHFWDQRWFLVHNSTQLHLCEVLPATN
ncbi:hypothetical protein [Shewanella sp. YIC-542]|uniref:hypothetical protein n=1 Tax=Shewanella mytili TaxID=3377111 RepID=UPI00398EF317